LNGKIFIFEIRLTTGITRGFSRPVDALVGQFIALLLANHMFAVQESLVPKRPGITPQGMF